MKKIIHIDMDYFFAQVEERDNPGLKNIPIAIGGVMNGRGVLCTSNYIARKFGVRSAMSTIRALQLCPHLTLVKPTFSKYKKVSEQIFEIYQEFTNKIQTLSLDEAYLDVTDTELFNNDANEIAKEIRRRIYIKTGLTASAGVSYNKLLAKIGSDLFKPNGMAILRPKNIIENISSFSISKINGVGKVTKKHMNELGIYTFGDLQKYSKLDLINLFGDYGATLFNYCRGVDEREVVCNEERKSLSVENTFMEDDDDLENLSFSLGEIYEEFTNRLARYSDRNIKSIFVKIKYHDFTSTTIESKIELGWEQFLQLFKLRFAQKVQPVRLLGLGVRFYPTMTKGQLELPLEYAQVS